ncbi:MAG: type II toxin-antitoxin system RelE/ParE family toxin [Verrucomicrobiaceae bacterium]|nr:type II toxin-antitoxin system RelE/ParE family toxin [Verrucomicrobiaceae bacterium]
MSLPVVIAERAERDMASQYGWYLENADSVVAERYLHAIDQSIQQLAADPALGVRRHFQADELRGIRSLQAARPFDKHLIFYRYDARLSIERVMHGARDLPIRLIELPEN